MQLVCAAKRQCKIRAISPATESLWDEEDGILTNQREKETEWERLTLITYLDYGYSDGTAPSFSVWARVSVHGDYSLAIRKALVAHLYASRIRPISAGLPYL